MTGPNRSNRSRISAIRESTRRLSKQVADAGCGLGHLCITGTHRGPYATASSGRRSSELGFSCRLPLGDVSVELDVHRRSASLAGARRRADVTRERRILTRCQSRSSGWVGTRDARRKGPPRRRPGRRLEWTDRSSIPATCSTSHEPMTERIRTACSSGTAPSHRSAAIAATVLHATQNVKVLVLTGPDSSNPSLARMAATLDHLTGGGRIAIHFITGGDEARPAPRGRLRGNRRTLPTHRRGDVDVRRIWSEDAPFDYDGEFFRYEDAFSSVKPVEPGDIPLYFGGASPAAIEVGASQADVYAFWGEPRVAVAQRMAAINTGCGQVGRKLRYSISLRAYYRRNRGGSLEKGGVDRRERPQSGSNSRSSAWQATRQPTQALGREDATFSVDRNTGGTTSVGRMRLIEMSTDNDVYDERLWMKVANLTVPRETHRTRRPRRNRLPKRCFATTTSALGPCS